MLVIEDLSKVFAKERNPSLQNIEAKIPKGEIVGIVGPDGSGKTTLLRLIAALLVPTKGAIRIGGFDTVTQPEEIRRITGYMPQKFGLYEELTVLQNLTLYADLQGLGVEGRKERFRELLQFANLEHFTERQAGALSGGMKQKLGLACATIKKPSYLLLDEPSVGVDPISRRELWKMVQGLVQEGVLILWSTSYLDEAEKCDRILLLNEGKLLYQGPPKELEKKVEGRVFQLKEYSVKKRALVIDLMQREDVVDATIQGSAIRLVMKEPKPPSVDAKIYPVEPRLEDAFIDIVGNAKKNASELAAKREKVELTKIPVQADQLTKKFGTFTAADHITFVLNKGEILGLLGPNGAGKTTTFKMLCGLLHPTSGKALVNGWDLEIAPGDARSQIGYMAQKFALYGTLTVRQNLEFFAGAYNIEEPARRQVVDEMIEIFSFEKYAHTNAEMLPLGYKRRLSLACANLHKPPILFLDEPTSGVDPITRREFWGHIYGLVEKGVSVLITTHFMDEAEFCDRIALIYRGQIIHMDTPDALKQNAITEENPDPTLEDAFIKLIEAYDNK